MRSDVAHVHYTSTAPVKDAKGPEWFEDDSEWEHEYHENETEDFYVTLDLTTHVPDALRRRETARNGKLPRGTMEARVKKTTSKKPPPSNVRETPDFHIVMEPSPAATQDPVKEAESILESAVIAPPPEISGKIQIIGLHTATPHIVFNGTFYTAYWLTMLGSELWVSRPGTVQDPIFKGHILDILGVSRARLMARAAKLEPRFLESGQNTTSSVPVVPPRDDDVVYEGVVEADVRDGPLVVPEDSVLDPSMRAHAAFMTRFAAIKWKMGERDQVPLHSIKHYTIPDNAPEIRKKAIDAEEEEEEGSTNKRQKLDTPSSVPSQYQPRFLPPITDLSAQGRQQRMQKSRQSQADDSEDDDSDQEVLEIDADDAEDATPVRAKSTGKGPIKYQARNARLESLGVRNPDDARPPRRKRRSKAEMEQAKAAPKSARWAL